MADKTTPSILYTFSKLLSLLKADRKDISAVYFFAIFGGIIQLSLPLGIQSIINFVQAGELSTSIVILILVVITGVFINGLLQVRQLEVIEKIEQKIFARYSLEFSDRIPKLNIEKLDKYHLPELTNRYFDTVSLIKSIEKILLDIPAAVIQILLGIILLSFYHPVFIAFGTLLILILLLIFKYTSEKGFATSLETSDQKYALAEWLEQEAFAVKTFKFSKNTSLHLKRADAILTGYLKARTAHFKVLMSQYWSFISFKLLITAAMLIVGTYLLIAQQINIGQFIASDIVIIAIISSVEKLISSFDKVYDVLTSVQKLSKITDAEIETSGDMELPSMERGVNIDFNKVTFAFSPENKIIQDIDIQIKANQIVCITGVSGSGKSTILKLLTASYKNYSGNILIDNLPIHQYQINSYRNQTGVLFKTSDIIKGTLLENITLGNPLITNDMIMTLASTLGLKQYILELKDGLLTELDTHGKILPNKIKKDVLIMRALLGKHRLLLLENPFEYLDAMQSQGLINYIQSEKNTTVIITTSEKVDMPFDLTIEMQSGIISKIK